MLIEISNIIAIGAALAAAFYCHTLSKKLKNFADTKTGIGKSISELTEALENIQTAMREAQKESGLRDEDLKARISDLEQNLALLKEQTATRDDAMPAPDHKTTTDEPVTPAGMRESNAGSNGEMPQFRIRKTRHDRPDAR